MVLVWRYALVLYFAVHFKVVCVGSIDELEKLSGIRATDLHREK